MFCEFLSSQHAKFWSSEGCLHQQPTSLFQFLCFECIFNLTESLLGQRSLNLSTEEHWRLTQENSLTDMFIMQ